MFTCELILPSSRVQHNHKHSVVQGYTARVAELESSNYKTLQELADFKAESKGLRNQELTIKRLEAQMGQIKAQLQNQVKCIELHLHYETRLLIPFSQSKKCRYSRQHYHLVHVQQFSLRSPLSC